jgi:hypothetical protein
VLAAPGRLARAGRLSQGRATIAGMAVVTWGEFAAERPDVAGPGRDLLYQFGVGLAFLSTVRPDGGPRLHPICPMVMGERLVAHIIPSPKRADLDRDDRFALHSFPAADNEDAFYVTGRAARMAGADLLHAAAAQFLAERQLETEPDGFGDGEFFELRIGRCLLTLTAGRGDWHPRHIAWVAEG